MNEYYVYDWGWHGEDHARIHRGDCGCSKSGKGVHQNKTGAGHRWHGPFQSYLAARAVAQSRSANVQDCGHCRNAGRVP